MNVHTEKVQLFSERRTELMNITTLAKEIVAKSRVPKRVVHIFTTHTTTADMINENEPGLERYVVALLISSAREDADYCYHDFFYKDDRMAVTDREEDT